MSNGEDQRRCCLLSLCCPPPPAPPYSAGLDEWREYGARLREWTHKRIAALRKMLVAEVGMDESSAVEAAAFMVENGLVRTVAPSFIADVQAALDNGVLKMPA